MGQAQVGRRAPVVADELSRQEAVVPRTGPISASPVHRAQHLGGHARGSSTGDMNRRRGHSIEPIGTGARVHLMGTVCVIAGMQGALPPHRYSQHEVTESFSRFPGFEAFEDMVRKLYASSKVFESIRATARLALSPPSGNTAPVAHESQIQAPERAPRFKAPARSSRRRFTPSVIPSAGSTVGVKRLRSRRHAGPKWEVRRHAQLRYATRHAGIVKRRSAVDMGGPTVSARSPLQLCRFSRHRSRCRR